MKTKDECYQQASFESLVESATETRQDVIYRAMEIYANEKLANFISSNPVLTEAARKPNLVKCSNCDEMVEMISSGEFCPCCFC